MKAVFSGPDRSQIEKDIEQWKVYHPNAKIINIKINEGKKGKLKANHVSGVIEYEE